MIDSGAIDRVCLPIVVFHAEGALTTLLGVSIEQAVVGPGLWAHSRGLSLVEAAEEIVDGRESGGEAPPTIDDEAFSSLRHHLDRSSSPLDHVHRPATSVSGVRCTRVAGSGTGPTLGA